MPIPTLRLKARLHTRALLADTKLNEAYQETMLLLERLDYTDEADRLRYTREVLQEALQDDPHATGTFDFEIETPISVSKAVALILCYSHDLIEVGGMSGIDHELTMKIGDEVWLVTDEGFVLCEATEDITT